MLLAHPSSIPYKLYEKSLSTLNNSGEKKKKKREEEKIKEQQEEKEWIDRYQRQSSKGLLARRHIPRGLDAQTPRSGNHGRQ